MSAIYVCVCKLTQASDVFSLLLIMHNFNNF